MADTKYTPRLKSEYNDRIKGVLTEIRLHQPDADAQAGQDRPQHGHR